MTTIGEQLISDAEQRMWASERNLNNMMDWYEREECTLDEYVNALENLLRDSKDLQSLKKEHTP